MSVCSARLWDLMCKMAACIILHNYVIQKEPIVSEDQDLENNLLSVSTVGRRSSGSVNRMRDRFAEYFLSTAGWLDWQEDYM